MRPVTQERRQPRPRGSGNRSPSRGITRGSVQPGSARREKSGGSGRLLGWIFGFLKSRHPMVWLSLGVIILTAAAAIVAGHVVDRTMQKTDAAAGAMVSDAGFGVAQVHLNGNNRTPASAIMTALDLKGGQSIFGVNLRQARARLLSLPWVADAEVTRRYPDDIEVRVVERVPFARWQTVKGLFVVEKQGRVIVPIAADKFAKLPLLLGSGAPENADAVLKAVARHRAIVARVQGYQYQSRRRWNLLLDDGVVVKLPEIGFERQLDALDKLIVEKGILETDIQEIDLRDPNYFYFKRRSGAGEQKDRKTEAGSAI